MDITTLLIIVAVICYSAVTAGTAVDAGTKERPES